AAPLTPRELAHGGVPRHVREQALEHVAHLRVPGPLVLGGIADDGAPHGRLGVEGVLLLEHTDAHPAAHRDAPRVRLALAGQQAQEARLAVAVAAPDADAVALVDPERDTVEDDGRGVLEAQGLSPEAMCHWVTSVLIPPCALSSGWSRARSPGAAPLVPRCRGLWARGGTKPSVGAAGSRCPRAAVRLGQPGAGPLVLGCRRCWARGGTKPSDV